jgi:hypothetical protein
MLKIDIGFQIGGQKYTILEKKFTEVSFSWLL